MYGERADRRTIKVEDRQVAIWQISCLWKQLFFLLYMQLAAAGILLICLRQKVPFASLLGWLTFSSVVWVLFWLFIRRVITSRQTISNPFRTLHLICIATLAGALPWASTCWMFEAIDLPTDVAVILVTSAVAVAAAQTLIFHFPSVIAFSLPIIVSLALRIMLAEVSQNGITLGIGLVTFFAFYLMANRHAHRAAMRNVRLSLKNVLQVRKLEHQVQVEEAVRHHTERALSIAERASFDKTRFLAAASHDLRQPVHAIGLFVAALKLEITEGRSKYLIDRLDRSLCGLDELFHRLLDISRLDAGIITPSIKVFGLHHVAQTLETRFSHLAASKGIQFRVRCPNNLSVRSDPDLLIELVTNLLSNAFRYTQRGGVLLAFRPRKESVLIQIWDTGCGIASTNYDLIFNEFTQLDNASHDRTKGLGLGLAVVKRLSGALDCRVRVSSAIGRGSLFEVDVERGPNEPPAPNAILRFDASNQDLSGALVLVVDDEIDTLTAMEAVLASWGCFAILARSTEEARKYVENSPRFPDVLITDHRLGNENTSFDVVKVLSDVLPYPIPVIVISGEPDTALEHRVSEMGWIFMKKPVSASDLRDNMLMVIKTSEMSAAA